MAPVTLIALFRAIFVGWKVTGSDDPKWAKERAEVRGIPQGYRKEVIDPFKAGYNTPIDEIRRKDAERAAHWRRIGRMLVIGFVLMIVVTALSVWYGNTH